MRKRILLIENVPDQVEALRIPLEEEGYEFLSALDGEEGLEKAHEKKPDLILLDLIMPKVDGLEVCNRLKQDAETSKVPIIVITAIATEEAKGKCLAAGADNLMTKPYDLEELLKEIKRLLEDKTRPHGPG